MYLGNAYIKPLIRNYEFLHITLYNFFHNFSILHFHAQHLYSIQLKSLFISYQMMTNTCGYIVNSGMRFRYLLQSVAKSALCGRPCIYKYL